MKPDSQELQRRIHKALTTKPSDLVGLEELRKHLITNKRSLVQRIKTILFEWAVSSDG